MPATDAKTIPIVDDEPDSGELVEFALNDVPGYRARAVAHFAMLAYTLDWETGAFLSPNYERYHLLRREVSRLTC